MIIPKKILAIKLRSLGDTVLMTASLQALRSIWPNVELHVVVYPEWAALLEGQPFVDRVWSFSRPPNPIQRLVSIGRFCLLLRPEQYDLVVNFHASPSSALLARGSGAKIRSVHFHGHADLNRFSTVTIPGKGSVKPAIERDLDAIRALGIPLPAEAFKQFAPFLKIQPAAATSNDRPTLVFGLGASRPTKIWPIRHYADIANRWIQHTQGAVLGVCGPGEASRFISLETLAPGTRITSNLSITQLAARLVGATAFVGNDSGPRHLAAALGVPTLTLFGPEDPLEWHPYDFDRHPFFFVTDLPCRPQATPGNPPWCGLKQCVIENHRCMTSITPEDVWLVLRRWAKK